MRDAEEQFTRLTREKTLNEEKLRRVELRYHFCKSKLDEINALLNKSRVEKSKEDGRLSKKIIVHDENKYLPVNDDEEKRYKYSNRDKVWLEKGKFTVTETDEESRCSRRSVSTSQLGKTESPGEFVSERRGRHQVRLGLEEKIRKRIID
jgi:hypothetical protein